jgi:hypothetical protein
MPLRTALGLGVQAEPSRGALITAQKAEGIAVEEGTHTEDLREFFLSGDKAAGILTLRRKDDGWSASLGKGLVPFVLTKQAVEGGFMPALGSSGMPASLQAVVPDRFKFWEKPAEEEARKCRDALVASRLFEGDDSLVKVVDGQLRLCVTRLFLYEPDNTEPASEPTLADSVWKVVGDVQTVATPFDEESWGDAYTKAADDDTVDLIVLSPEQPSMVEEAVAVVNITDRCVKVLVEGPDTSEVRKALAQAGRVFKFTKHPESVFVATFDLSTEHGVEWIDKADPEPVGKPFAGYTDFAECEKAQRAAGKTDEEAAKICGSLQAQTEKRYSPSRFIIAKAEDTGEERYVFGIVLEPEVRDAQGDIYSTEEIRQACFKYMEAFRGNTYMHDNHIEGKVVILENYLAPDDFAIGEESIKKGTWLQAYRIADDDIWELCKKGELDGFSIGGSAVRTPETD